nr:hypothetical protein B0A51_03247 [Rachicladosporium sp. CCFEE 5018]
MAEKRKSTDTSDARPFKVRKGFQVGPANLPEGMHKRKTQQIKQSLIQRALIKKDYARLKKQGKIPEVEGLPVPASSHLDRPPSTEEADFAGFPDHNSAAPVESAPAPVISEPHPDRQTLINASVSPEPAPPAPRPPRDPNRKRERKPRPNPFQKERDAALEAQAAADERRRVREEAERERAVRMEARERERRAMAKARSAGRNGQRKLGRESGVLLARVQRMVGQGKV